MDSFGESQSWHRGVSEAGEELFKGDISGVNPRDAKIQAMNLALKANKEHLKLGRRL